MLLDNDDSISLSVERISADALIITGFFVKQPGKCRKLSLIDDSPGRIPTSCVNVKPGGLSGFQQLSPVYPYKCVWRSLPCGNLPEAVTRTKHTSIIAGYTEAASSCSSLRFPVKTTLHSYQQIVYRLFLQQYW